MLLIESVHEMREYGRQATAAGKVTALVPTMGYLHEGHASLMREGRRRSDLLVASIFVNPTQFGAGEDFDSYPRDLQRDRAVAEAAGVDVIFAPKASEMYPAGFQTFVEPGPLAGHLCGASRPGHFRGVCTVVAKLFGIVMPAVALFGMKDFQQLAIIRRMTADLNLPVEVLGMPIVREPDGLAMSSRNAYLSGEERTRALCLSRSLSAAKDLYAAGERDAGVIRREVLGVLAQEPHAMVDYAEVRDGDTLEEIGTIGETLLVALAVRIGKTRLIDNCLLGGADA